LPFRASARRKRKRLAKSAIVSRYGRWRAPHSSALIV
jgi:hypothetical protein